MECCREQEACGDACDEDAKDDVVLLRTLSLSAGEEERCLRIDYGNGQQVGVDVACLDVHME